MTNHNPSKRSWTTREVAFIIGYADHCIHYGLDYADTVTHELFRVSSRDVTWNTVRGRVERVFRGFGVQDPSIQQFMNQGTAYLDLAAIPSDVFQELNQLRKEWGFARWSADPPSPRRSNDALGDTFPDDETENNKAEPQAGLDHVADQRSETLQVENTPEPHNGDLTAIDGAADRPVMSPISTISPITPPWQAAVRKRSATPEDPDDHEYEPSRKRNKSTRTSSTHVPVTSPKGKKGWAITKGIAVPKNVAVRKASASHAQHHTATPDKATPVVVIIDDAPEQAQFVASSSRLTGNTAPSMDHITEATTHTFGKRKAVEMSDEDIVMIEPPTKKQNTGNSTLASVNNKLDVCLSIMSAFVTHQQSLPEDIVEHVNQLLRTCKDPNGSIVEDLVKDLNSQRALKIKHRNVVKKLIEYVNLNTGAVFPKTPPQNEVDKAWSMFYDHVVSTVGPNNATPKISPSSAGYLACAVENITYGRIPNDQLEAYIDSIDPIIKSPHAQQALFSALLFRWAFASPEPMLNNMHSDGMMHHYNTILAAEKTNADGLARVQQYDKAAAKMMFEDDDFKDTEVARRVKHFKVRFEEAKEKRCASSKIPSALSPGRFAKEVVDLKQRFLLSPKDYRTHYVRPGKPFCAAWTQAYSQSNDPIPDTEAEGKKVLLCVFPALFCQEPAALKEGAKIEDVLCKNKRFHPTFEESTKDSLPGSAVSKAVVLLL